MVKHTVEVTAEDLSKLWDRQKGRCALTNLKMLSPNDKNINSLFCASLDRIDSDGEYTLDNVQFITRAANWLKNNHTQEEALEYFNAAANSILGEQNEK